MFEQTTFITVTWPTTRSVLAAGEVAEPALVQRKQMMSSTNTSVRSHRFSLRMMGAAGLAVGVFLGGSVASAAPITTFGYTGSLQSFTVVEAGNYIITAFGAQGGSGIRSGGLGAETAGTLFLSTGEVLSVLVGGSGGSGSSSGGGGSFVFTGSGASATPLVVAGGGGGFGGLNNGLAGQTGPSGGTGGGGTGGTGGIAGAGGSGGSGANFAGGGGGGFFGAGSGGSVSVVGFTGGGGGQAATAGGGGGGDADGGGGYGGGGGGSRGSASGGGGGGYSGGGGGGGTEAPGGGGGSFLALNASNDTLLGGVQSGNGVVTFDFLPAAVTSVPEPASLVLLGVGAAGIAATKRRRRA